MKTSTQNETMNLQALLRDLRERALAAEGRANDAETRAQTAESQNELLNQKLKAQDDLITALMDRLISLTKRLALATDRAQQLALEFELKAVQRRLNDLNHDRFGDSSERRGRPEGATPKTTKNPKKQTGHGPTPQPDLQVQPQLHLLDEPDQICPHCNPPRPLDPWRGQTVDAEEITVIERTFRINLHQRQVYKCDGCGHIDVAIGPDRLITGGRYSPEFAATVAADKYADALPLTRQVRRMKEQGLRVTSQTLWDQICALYVLLLPVYLLLQEKILQSEVVFADETSWRLMGKGRSKRWWVWGVTDDQRVFFLLAPTRGAAAARQLLQNYSGIVMADRYKVYESLEKARTRQGGQQTLLQLDGEPPRLLPTPDYELAACWMHGRRGFVKAARHGEAEAEKALNLIGELYAVEARARDQVASIADREERKAALIRVRAGMRDTESRAIIGRLRTWMDTTVVVPRLPTSDAIRWLKNGWVQLTRFLEDGRIPLDNGLAERVIRGVVIGRKNYAGSRSEKGTQVAALFYSIVETCRLQGIAPQAYLVAAARHALVDRGSALMPSDYAAALAAAADENRPDVG